MTTKTYAMESMLFRVAEKYDTGDDSGSGLVFIAESYDKPNGKGAYWVTFFDIGSKKIIKTQRFEGKAKGFGLRNYWANSYYQVMKEAGKTLGNP